VRNWIEVSSDRRWKISAVSARRVSDMPLSILAVDVGGTWMRCAMVENGKLMLPLKKNAPGFRFNSLPLADLQDMFLREISALVDHYTDKGFSVMGVAISFPGPMKDGEVYGASTLWGKMDNPFPLISALKKELGKKGITDVFAVNDVTAVGRSYVNGENRTFCIITVSSGIGNKIFHNGEVLSGEKAIGGEIGHWYCGDAYREFVCDCGGRGHLGAVSSGRGIEKVADKLKHEFTEISDIASLDHIGTADIVDGIRKGDVFALKTLEFSVAPLASAINLINLSTGIDDFILVGGFALSGGEIYVNTLRKSVGSQLFKGHFTEKGNGINLSLGVDSDFQALVGLSRMMDDRMKSCGIAGRFGRA
jgi:predicted NBD/HSP70 family sugar kinase